MDKMCTRNGTTDGTTLTIENWAFYQDARRTDGTPNETPNGTPNETPNGTLNYKDTKIQGYNDLSLKKWNDANINPKYLPNLEALRERVRKVNEGRSK